MSMRTNASAIQRRNHKERAQPAEREKWGLLEKRKDYKLRAKDHKDKQKKLKILRQHASERNPDEFSFSMINSQVDKAGRKIASRGNKTLNQDVVKLLKTQDAAYIRTMLQMVRKERQALEERIVLEDNEVRALKDGDAGKKRDHTVFVGDKEQQREFRADEWFGTGADLIGRFWSRRKREEEKHSQQREEAGGASAESSADQPKKLTKKQLEAQELAKKEERSLRKKRTDASRKLAAQLEGLKTRERDLMIAEEELEKQRAKMNNTIGGTNKHGVKFKLRERKT